MSDLTNAVFGKEFQKDVAWLSVHALRFCYVSRE